MTKQIDESLKVTSTISPNYSSETLQALAEAEKISTHPEGFEGFSSAADLIGSIKNEKD